MLILPSPAAITETITFLRDQSAQVGDVASARAFGRVLARIAEGVLDEVLLGLDGVWRIPSASGGSSYRVSALACSCKHGQHRSTGLCWHRALVEGIDGAWNLMADEADSEAGADPEGAALALWE